MSRRIALGPVAFELGHDDLIARLRAIVDDRELQVVARCLPGGVIRDLQVTGPRGEFRAGSTGVAELDALIRDAIELAYITARNATVIQQAQRREWRARRNYRKARRW
jgi:hypothetical protein